METNVTAHLSTFDRVINIYQAKNIGEIKKLNQQMLGQQIKQNEQLSKLNKELSAANSMTKQILQNQIKEIKNKEEQKFYKNLSFTMGLLIDKISCINDDLLRYYAIESYYERIKTNLLLSMELFDEINDKVYSKNLLNKAEATKSNLVKKQQAFQNSELGYLNDLIVDVKNKEAELLNLANTKVVRLTKKSSGCLVLIYGFLISLFAVAIFQAISDATTPLVATVIFLTLAFSMGFWCYKMYRKNLDYKSEIALADEASKVESEKHAIKLRMELSNHPIHKKLADINSSYPQFDSVTKELIEIETAFLQHR